MPIVFVNLMYYTISRKEIDTISIFPKVGVFLVKLNGHNPVDLIINHRKLIEKVFTILVVFSLICIPDGRHQLRPDQVPSRLLPVRSRRSTSWRTSSPIPGMGRVMLHDVTLYEAKNIKDRIADVEGVDMVMWADMTANIYGSSEFIDYDDIDDYYHEDDQSAYMDVIFEDKDSSSQTHKAVQVDRAIDRRPADSSPAPPCPTPTSARPSTKRSRASWCSRSSSFTSS